MKFTTAAAAAMAASQISGVAATFHPWHWASHNQVTCWLWKSCPNPTTPVKAKKVKFPWPPAPPSSSCPPKWPWPVHAWKHKSGIPGVCPKGPKHGGVPPIYPPGCTPNPPPAPQKTNFTLACPDRSAGQIFDGQIQCNSPYPGQEVDAGIRSYVSSTFYLRNGALYDQLGRACEISAGNQLQCNVLPVNTQAEVGFAIDQASDLIWQGENTWYGCNIGTDNSFGQILFTGTHKEFPGTSAATENPNCAAYRLSVVFVA